MKDIKGFEGLYAVTEDGRVWSYPKLGSSLKGKWLRHGIHKKGYLNYYFQINKKKQTFFAHRLVALTYIPNPQNLPEVNHINGIKTDNRVENLEWCSHLDNIRHAYQLNLIPAVKGEKHGMSKLKEHQVLQIRAKWKGGEHFESLALAYNVHLDTIKNIIRRRNWKHI